MRSGVRLRGFRTAKRKIEVLARAGGESMVNGGLVIGETIMTDVKASRPGAGVPRDTGALGASGRVTGPDRGGVVRLTFGGAAAPYALKQHEELSYRHTLGEARYLVRGVERWAAGDKAIDALRANAKYAIAASFRNRSGRFDRVAWARARPRDEMGRWI